ncbi:MAG: nucleotidyl transferase AbiEii/AbiGii toxin family protein [Rhodothermaceae bacterium]|nr:nucleotidyl transferase AbiEii/AbiGii toxin family protein [Rhodothermaceae bacterium]MYF78725.1 nucleotidyl transferase AbiEii/AbiGii toxin family protein [Chloroflexota bacterium]
MAEIDAWSDVLSPEMRAVWPLLRNATRRIDGCLMGGTALAIHLRHRVSFDLDYMTNKGFSGDRLARKLKDVTDDIEVHASGPDQMHARVNGVVVQVFRVPFRGANPGHVKTLKRPLKVDDLPVASLPDLLASKLDVIMYRPKLRDYIDLMAMDMASPYTLEDGLSFHMRRYGITPASNDAARIVQLLAAPGELEIDPVFQDRKDGVLRYLANRAPDLEQRLHQMRRSHDNETGPEPPDRTRQVGLTATFDELVTAHNRSLSAPAKRNRSRCRHIGKRTKKRCVLASGHRGSHRY